MDKKKITIILIAVIAGFICFSCCCCSALFLIGSNTETTSESSSETISETTTSTITSTKETTKATETEPETTTEITTTNETTTINNIQFDELQSLYLLLSENYTEKELIDYIMQNDLSYTRQEYNGGTICRKKYNIKLLLQTV